MPETNFEHGSPDVSTQVFANRLTRCKVMIGSFLVAIAACLSTADLAPLAAQDGEFPDEWYFSSMQKMRESLEGLPAPEISADSWIGDETSLKESRGKVVVLDFWATWCGPCVASIPENISMVNEHPDDLVFIGMHSAASGWDKAEKMVEDREMNYPVALDTGDTADTYQVIGFPTYIIIDADGLVRAAGVMPSSIKKVVEKLLEESGSSGNSMQFASLNREWLHSGASWMRTWQDQFGQPAKPIQPTAWWMPGNEDTGNRETGDQDTGNKETGDAISESDQGESEKLPQDEDSTDVAAPEGYAESDIEGSVRVLHFTRPGMSITDRQLKKLNEAAKKYSPQGVVFTAVCDHQSDWKQSKLLAAKIGLQMPMVLDRDATIAKPVGEVAGEKVTSEKAASEKVASAEDADVESTEAHAAAADKTAGTPAPEPAIKSAPRESGETARSYHVRIAPVTVLIDRQGRIRATGLRMEQLGNALDLMLAEQGG